MPALCRNAYARVPECAAGGGRGAHGVRDLPWSALGVVGDSDGRFDAAAEALFQRMVQEGWPEGVPAWARALVV